MNKKMKLLWIFIGIPLAIYLIVLLNNMRNLRLMSITENLECETVLEKRELNEDYRLCESVKLIPATIRGLVISLLVFALLFRFTRKSKH